MKDLDNTYVILIRHGESKKNVKNIQGGSGEGLTKLGKVQAKKVAEKIDGYFKKSMPMEIFCAPSVHTIETGTIISRFLGVDLRVCNYLKPLYLGVFDGLDVKSIEILYPEEYQMLCKWRKREIDISDLKIPAMEDVKIFWDRGVDALLETNRGVNIFVLTNSLFILLSNILLKRGIAKGEGYKHIEIGNCEMAVFLKEIDGNYIYQKKMSDVLVI